MKHNTLFRLFFISIFLSTLLVSCLDDPLNGGQPGMDTPSGKLSVMRDYFESTSPALRQVGFGSSARSRVGSSPWSSYDLSPNWDKARVWESYKKTYVEVPLKGDGVFRSSIIGSGRRNKSYPARSFLILTLDHTTEDIHYHVATTVLETRGRTKPKEEDFQYVGNSGFNGFLIFSSVSGRFLKAFHIRGGKSHLVYIGPSKASTRSSGSSSRAYHLLLTPSVVRYSYDESGGGGGLVSGNYQYCQTCRRLYNVDLNTECPFCKEESGGDSGGGSGGDDSSGTIYCPICNQPYDFTLESCPNGCEIEITPPEGDLIYCEICGIVYDSGRYRSCPNGCEVFYCDVCGKFPCICLEHACERCGSITCPGPWFCSERECTGEKCKVCGGYKANTRSGSDCPVCTCAGDDDKDYSAILKVNGKLEETLDLGKPYILEITTDLPGNEIYQILYQIRDDGGGATNFVPFTTQERYYKELLLNTYAYRPGNYTLRVQIDKRMGDSNPIYSSTVKLTVQNPLVTYIISIPKVSKKMNEVWEQSKESLGGKFRESGFAIYYNTDESLKTEDERYSFSEVEYGEWVDMCVSMTQTVTVNANFFDMGATYPGKYVVAWFHTHPPYRCTDRNKIRPVGPSTLEDYTIAGIVYDYIGDDGTLDPTHKLNDPAKVWTYGEKREPASRKK